MKSIILLGKLVAMLAAKPAPNNIPAELVGKWLNGSFSMSSWWSYDGKKYLGNPYTRSVAFDFSKSGDAKFFLVIKTNTGYCTTEAFTYLEGNVVINEAERSITLVPKKGNYRGFYSCAPGSNFNRPAKPEELKSTKYYWTMETNNGEKYMVIRFSPNTSEAGSYFKPSDW
jgi:hypothetical protein